jgi:hypothetical protein
MHCREAPYHLPFSVHLRALRASVARRDRAPYQGYVRNSPAWNLRQ